MTHEGFSDQGAIFSRLGKITGLRFWNCLSRGGKYKFMSGQISHHVCHAVHTVKDLRSLNKLCQLKNSVTELLGATAVKGRYNWKFKLVIHFQWIQKLIGNGIRIEIEI